MKYQVCVYFDGPRSQWGNNLHPEECIFVDESPWLWLARKTARAHLGNTGNCSYAITSGGKLIEQERGKKTSRIEVTA